MSYCMRCSAWECRLWLAAPQDHSQPQPTYPGRTPHVVEHGLILLMMGIIMSETCWDRSLIINIELVASCWFSLLTLNQILRLLVKLRFFTFTYLVAC